MTSKNNTLLYVHAKIAGEHVNMLVDTGASENFAPSSLVLALVLPVVETKP